MPKKYLNKYRSDSIRLKNYDYGKNGIYYITICTEDREKYFGNVCNGKMELSETGKIADEIWNEIPNQFKFAKLDEYIIMPNHIHGIIIIDKTNMVDVADRDAINRVPMPTNNHNKIGGITGINNPMLHKNLGRILRWYKGRVTFESRKINPKFKWQSRYYDSILWNKKSLNRVRKYIIDNPKNW